MKRLGIIQPGKIGDIVICLPIAKWYADRGYEVIWPIDRNIINNFEGYVDYVRFVPIDFDCMKANQLCYSEFCNKIIDISFTIPGANSLNSNNYLTQPNYSFDEYKYYLADVPFEEKWNLVINRNHDKERALVEKLKVPKEYVVINTKASDYCRPVSWENPDIPAIEIVPIDGYGVFDWLSVLERAKQLILIESCFSNIVDQLNMKVEKNILLLKEGYYGSSLADGRLRGTPKLKLDWITR